MIQGQLGATHAAAFDLECACTGFIWGMHIGALFLAQRIYRNALIIGSDIPSRALNYNDHTSFILMGDGAGACILRRSESTKGILAEYFHSDGARWDAVTIKGGGTRYPDIRKVDPSEIHDMFFKMNGLKVFKFGVLSLVESIDELLKCSGLNPDQIDIVIPHQPNRRIFELAMRRCSIPSSKLFIDLDKFGNTASASVAMALADANQGGRLRRGDRVMLVGFGAGLSWGGIVLEW
jgi:3-oxoacyl-[acyl-carrier-protein] synthase III